MNSTQEIEQRKKELVQLDLLKISQKLESIMDDTIKIFDEEIIELDNSKDKTNDSKIKMLKTIMIWQHNMTFAKKIDNYTNDEVRQYLLDNFGRYFGITSHLSLDDIVDGIPEGEIVGHFKKEELVDEQLCSYNANGSKLNCTDTILFTGPTLQALRVFNDDLLCSNTYREYLYTGDRSIPFTVPLEIKNGSHVIQAIDGLIRGDVKYHEFLEILEDFYQFVKVFQYLELKFV
jgi:hypothetical protein